MINGLVKIKKSEMASASRDEIKKMLTIFPVSTSAFNLNPDPIRLWMENEEFIAVPRGFYFEHVKKRYDPAYVFEFSHGRSELRKAKGVSLREGQPEIIDESMEIMSSQDFGGVIVEAGVGSGKTLISLEIARRLGRKTLIIVHTSVLMEQWIVEIKKHYPEWSVGKVQGQTVDVLNNDVCVGMLQSLSMKDDYPEWLYGEFGTIIFDEIHTVASQEFSKALFRFNPRYIIGVSGTLKRADRAENVFKFALGPVVKAMSKVKTMTPTIYFVDTKYVIDDFAMSDYSYAKNGMLKDICGSEARNKVIIDNTVNAAIKGRHVLILTERVIHVETLFRELVKQLTPKNIKVGMMIGDSTKAEREYAQTSQVLVATDKLLAVGFNNPRLDTLVFATPIQKVVQPVGRVVRTHPDKRPPIVVDLVDTSSKSSRILAKSRKKQYLNQGWMIKNQEILDDTKGRQVYGFSPRRG